MRNPPEKINFRGAVKNARFPPLHWWEAVALSRSLPAKRPSGQFKGGRHANGAFNGSLARGDRTDSDLSAREDGFIRLPGAGWPEGHGMRRLWYVDIQRRDDAFLLQASNVFDGCEAEEPVSARLADPLDVEAVLRALKPVTRISRRHMEINGIGSLLRIASLSRIPLDDLTAQALKLSAPEPPSVLVTSFLTRQEVSACFRRRHDPRETGRT